MLWDQTPTKPSCLQDSQYRLQSQRHALCDHRQQRCGGCMEDWSKRTLQSESLARKRSNGKGTENKIQPRKLASFPWKKWRLGNYFPLWEGLFSGAVLVLGSVKVGRLIRFFFVSIASSKPIDYTPDSESPKPAHSEMEESVPLLALGEKNELSNIQDAKCPLSWTKKLIGFDVFWPSQKHILFWEKHRELTPTVRGVLLVNEMSKPTH